MRFLKVCGVICSISFFVSCGHERPTSQLNSVESAFAYRITTNDALALPGQTFQLVAKVETADPFRFDIDDAQVDFWLGDEYLGFGVTDDEGIAYVLATAPEDVGTHVFTARYKRWVSEGRAFVETADTRFFVTDIDQTISDLTEALVPVTPNQAIPAVPGAVRALGTLSQTRGVIYLTARDDYLVDKTRNWIAMRGFPEGPVFFNDWRFGGASQGDYKERVLRDLKESFPSIEAGAGENLHDAEAYIANGMRAYLIGKSLDGAISVSGWNDILASEQR
jgi:hypothetical protein